MKKDINLFHYAIVGLLVVLIALQFWSPQFGPRPISKEDVNIMAPGVDPETTNHNWENDCSINCIMDTFNEGETNNYDGNYFEHTIEVVQIYDNAISIKVNDLNRIIGVGNYETFFDGEIRVYVESINYYQELEKTVLKICVPLING